VTKINYKSYIHIAFFSILVVLSFFVVRPFLPALFLGALMAYLSYPLYRWLRGKLNNSTIVALIVCFGIILIILIPSIFFIKSLVQESYVIYILAKQKLAVGFFRGCENYFCNTLQGFGQDPLIGSRIQEIIQAGTNLIIKKGSDFLISLPKAIMNVFVIFFTMFYFLKDGKSFLTWFGEFMGEQKSKYALILKRLDEITHGVVFGYLFVSLIQGAVGALGFFVFGIPSPLFWGVVMAFLALVPYLGTGFIWAPAALILLLNGVFQDSTMGIVKGVGLFLYGLVVISGIDNILRPKLMSNKAKIHPAIILIGILGGIFFFGPLGVLVGPLVLSMTVVFIRVYVNDPN
jgi:predicted PurR-regulated permease PerM